MNGPDPATTDRIIQEWSNGRMARDYLDFVSLYAYNGYYVDPACRFEANGRWGIRGMIGRHLKSADYAVVDPVAITYTDDGASVQWVWSGTYEGEPFTLEPTTTVEIEDGLIVASIDSYDLADATLYCEVAQRWPNEARRPWHSSSMTRKTRFAPSYDQL